MAVLFKCSCGAALVIDEGATVRVAMRNWRMNKTTGYTTANCPHCPSTFVIDGGIMRKGEENSKSTPNILFAVGAV